MDDVDRAKALELEQREAAIKAALNRPSQEQVRDANSNIICSDCKVRLKKARLKAHPGATRCVSCQEAEEKSER